MRRMLAVLALGAVMACPTQAGAPAGPAGDLVTRELAADEPVALNPLTLRGVTRFNLTVGQARLEFRASPDGLVEFLRVDLPAKITLVGAKGNRASLGLRAGERISAWPVAKATVCARTGEFTVDAAMADWAFVVHADQVRREGLPVLCDGLPCTLPKGERLDTDLMGKRVVFRVVGKAWPGTLVRAQSNSEPAAERRKKPTTTLVETDEKVAEPVSPGVLTDRARDFSWQSVSLPTISY